METKREVFGRYADEYYKARIVKSERKKLTDIINNERQRICSKNAKCEVKIIKKLHRMIYLFQYHSWIRKYSFPFLTVCLVS